MIITIEMRCNWALVPLFSLDVSDSSLFPELSFSQRNNRRRVGVKRVRGRGGEKVWIKYQMTSVCVWLFRGGKKKKKNHSQRLQNVKVYYSTVYTMKTLKNVYSLVYIVHYVPYDTGKDIFIWEKKGEKKVFFFSLVALIPETRVIQHKRLW